MIVLGQPLVADRGARAIVVILEEIDGAFLLSLAEVLAAHYEEENEGYGNGTHNATNNAADDGADVRLGPGHVLGNWDARDVMITHPLLLPVPDPSVLVG